MNVRQDNWLYQRYTGWDTIKYPVIDCFICSSKYTRIVQPFAAATRKLCPPMASRIDQALGIETGVGTRRPSDKPHGAAPVYSLSSIPAIVGALDIY